MKTAVVLFALVAAASAHTWLVSPRSRGTPPGGSLGWQANKPECSELSQTVNGVTYNTQTVDVVDSYTAGQTVTVTWYDEHPSGSTVPWPDCSDTAQLMHIELGDSANQPTNFRPLGSTCAADLSMDVTIPSNLASDTYTVRMKWNFLDQVRHNSGNPNHQGPHIFYDCADVTVEQNTEQGAVSAADAAAFIRQYAWAMLLLALCPIGACLVYAQRQKVVSSRMTRMTAASIMSADSTYADARSSRSSGAGSGGNRTTMASAMTADSTGYKSGMTGISSMTADRASGISGISGASNMASAASGASFSTNTASMYTNVSGGSGGNRSRGSRGGNRSRGSRGSRGGNRSRGSRGSGGNRSRGSRS